MSSDTVEKKPKTKLSYNNDTLSITSKFEEISFFDLTDKERLCYHKFVFVGKSPVLDEKWYNCEKCHISKEKYEKYQKHNGSKLNGTTEKTKSLF